MGYTGGELFEPTYKRIGDHTEAILIEFNEELTYEDILEKFWRDHTPGISMRQYRSAVFYHDEAQKQAAEAMQAQLIADGKKWCRHNFPIPGSSFDLRGGGFGSGQHWAAAPFRLKEPSLSRWRPIAVTTAWPSSSAPCGCRRAGFLPRAHRRRAL